MLPDGKIDASVVASSEHRGGVQPLVISHIDLTQPFGTATQWTFVVVQEARQASTELEDRGPLAICFVKASHPDCSEVFYERTGKGDPSLGAPYHLLASSIVYGGRHQVKPLLLVKLCGAQGPNGNCALATALYQYDRGADRFSRVFLNMTGRNNNQATRFVESGPMQGDVIVDYPTEDAPYTYWIEVYRAEQAGQFVEALHYRGRTGYGDGNPLTVIDSEMPATLLHFGLWKAGDAPPIPAHMPKGCSRLYMRQDEEWCK